MEFLCSLLRRRFARAQVATSRHVGCFLRLNFCKSRNEHTAQKVGSRPKRARKPWGPGCVFTGDDHPCRFTTRPKLFQRRLVVPDRSPATASISYFDSLLVDFTVKKLTETKQKLRGRGNATARSTARSCRERLRPEARRNIRSFDM